MKTPQAFIDYFGAKQTSMSVPAFDAYVAPLAKLFLRCTAPVYKELVPELVGAQHRFFDQYAAQLAVIESEVEASVTQAAAAEGIRYSSVPAR